MKYREKIKGDILLRSKSAYGHLNKVISMMEDDECLCMDILNQLTAVESALRKVEEIILENHLRDCLVKKRYGHTQSKIAEEVANGVVNEVMEACKRKHIQESK